MNLVKVSLVCMSHLSDIQEMVISENKPDYIVSRVNFVKFLLMKYRNTETLINPDKEFEDFKKWSNITTKFGNQKNFFIFAVTKQTSNESN